MRSLPLKAAVLAVAFVAIVIVSATSRAQRPNPGGRTNPNTGTDPNAAASPAASPVPNRFWRCELPGGVFLCTLSSLQSVSTHEYIVDGAARVTEVTIATNSSVEGRFYYLEPVVPTAAGATLQQLQQHVQDLASSHVAADDQVWQKVVKNYPTTTHAHTVEYRLSSKENLQQIYASLEQAWTTGRGASLKTE